jgi:invasion protein IalB
MDFEAMSALTKWSFKRLCFLPASTRGSWVKQICSNDETTKKPSQLTQKVFEQKTMQSQEQWSGFFLALRR